MSPNEQQILEVLRELDAAVKSLRPGADPISNKATVKPDFGTFSRRLDELSAKLAADSDPNLRHYLERRSYEKARLFLEGQSAQSLKGTCGKKS